jgi:hypothetical protein
VAVRIRTVMQANHGLATSQAGKQRGVVKVKAVVVLRRRAWPWEVAGWRTMRLALKRR